MRLSSGCIRYESRSQSNSDETIDTMRMFTADNMHTHCGHEGWDIVHMTQKKSITIEYTIKTSSTRTPVGPRTRKTGISIETNALA